MAYRDTGSLPDFPGDVAGAMTAFLTLVSPEVCILPGLALLCGDAGLVHNRAIVSAKQPARWIQQVGPFQAQKACNAGDTPLVYWLVAVPAPQALTVLQDLAGWKTGCFGRPYDLEHQLL